MLFDQERLQKTRMENAAKDMVMASEKDSAMHIRGGAKALGHLNHDAGGPDHVMGMARSSGGRQEQDAPEEGCMCEQCGRFRTDDTRVEKKTRQLSKKRKSESKTDYKVIKKEAKAELRSVRTSATRMYELSLEQAKQQYLRSSEQCRDAYQRAKDAAKEYYERSLEQAKNDYEFTVDIAKDQYKTTKDVFTENGQPSPVASPPALSSYGGAPDTKVLYDVRNERVGSDTEKRLKMADEIRQMVAESEKEWSGEVRELSSNTERW